MRRILATGSSGPIGAALLPALRSADYDVTRLVRGPASREHEISWDPLQPVAPESVSGFDAVIHLAGETIANRWSEAKKARIRDSRVLGTRNLATALANASHPPRVLMTASAIGYYGNRGEEVLTEDSPSGQGFLAGVCREWEAASQSAAAAGIRTLHLRFGLVLSGAGGALPKMLLPFRLGLGGRIGSGRQWWSWIAVQDIAGAVLHLLKSEISGAVNLVSPNPVSNADFTRGLGRALSRPTFFPMPAFVARAAFGEMGQELLLSSQRVEPGRLLASGYAFRYPELAGALQMILGG